MRKLIKQSNFGPKNVFLIHGRTVSNKGWIQLETDDGEMSKKVILDLDEEEAFNLAFQLMDAIRIFKSYREEA